MKILVRLFKYTIFSAAVSLATSVIALFIGIFFLLHRESPENRPSGALTPQGSISDIAASTPDVHALPPSERTLLNQESKFQRAIAQLKFVDEMEDEARKAPVRNLCEIICDEPQFRAGHLDFVSFYKAEGRHSFDDVDFRLQLESSLLIKRIFPPESLQVVSDITTYDALNKSTSEKLSTALRIEGQVLRELFLMGRRLPGLQERNKKLSAIKKLRGQCASKSADEIKVACTLNKDAFAL
jgi:hypothetical protein